MDQGLKRVVARGVRPHVPYRNLNKVRNKLIEKRIDHLINLFDLSASCKRQLKRMSYVGYGSDRYYYLKDQISQLKQETEEIKKQDWFLRYRETYFAKKESRYVSRRRYHLHESIKRNL